MATTSQGNPFPTSDSPAGSTGGSGSLSGSSGGLGGSGTGSSGSTGGSSFGENAGYGGSAGTSSYAGSTGRDETMSRVVQGAHQAVDRLAEKATPVVERLKGTLSGATQSLHSGTDQLSAMQEEWVETARTTVREHPIASVLTAVAAGVLLSKLMSR